MKRLGGLLAWCCAVAVLHVASITPLPFVGAQAGEAWYRLSPDAVFLLALAAVGAAAGRPRVAAHVAALLLLAAATYRTAGFYVGVLLDRRLDLTFDVMDLPAVVHLLTHDTSFAPWMLVTGVALALVVAWWLLAWAFARAARPARGGRSAVLLAVVLQVLVLGDVVRHSVGRDTATTWHPSALWPLVGDVRDSLGYWLHREEFDGGIRADLAVAAERMAAAPKDLAGLQGADVHVVIVESYGRFALREPSVRDRLHDLWRERGPALRDAGFSACTAACAPSVSGGASWLSHAQLMTSARVAHRRQFQLMLQSEIEPLPRRFQAAGYRTVEVMPAMDRHWPEGQAFYGFDESVTQLELGYTGTVYHWGLMPDQFALHHLLERYVLPARQPLFSLFVSVTSHVPFRRVPPYVADWRIDADTFRGPPRVDHEVSWSGVPHDPRLVTAYADTLEYALRTAIDFTVRLPRPSLVIVLGDHQPPIAVGGRTRDSSYDVPIHVLANRPELLTPCRQLGFVDGFELPESAQSFPATEFAPAFLRLYSAEPR